MTEEQEMIKMGIIDSLLYASCFGCKNAIIEDGNYSIQFNDGMTGASLKITRISESAQYSIMGLVNGRMFYSTETLTVNNFYSHETNQFEPIEIGNEYYAYAEYTDGLETNPSEFRVRLYDSEQAKSDQRLPLCIISTSTENPSVNLDVDKPHAKNILSHVIDTTNPHGETLRQKNLEITNSLSINGNSILGSIQSSYVTVQSGEYEWTPPEGKSPVFAHAYPESIDAGMITWRITPYGTIIFYNSGNPGITVNIKIELEPI